MEKEKKKQLLRAVKFVLFSASAGIIQIGLFTLLNERMRMKRHTIIATNLNAEQMQARYGDRVASRLMDTKDTMIIGFAGGDVRTRRNR